MTLISSWKTTGAMIKLKGITKYSVFSLIIQSRYYAFRTSNFVKMVAPCSYRAEDKYFIVNMWWQGDTHLARKE